jgi:hypothetical protein
MAVIQWLHTLASSSSRMDFSYTEEWLAAKLKQQR